MVVAVRIEDKGSFRAAAAALKGMDKSLSRELTYVLRKQVQPLMAEQRSAVRALPVSGVSGSTGLRRKVARGVRAKVAVSRMPKLRIITAMPNDGGKNGGLSMAWAPRGLESSFGGWRAPLYGNKHRWFPHSMKGPSWFIQPAVRKQPYLQNQVIKTLNATAIDIARTASALRG